MSLEEAVEEVKSLAILYQDGNTASRRDFIKQYQRYVQMIAESVEGYGPRYGMDEYILQVLNEAIWLAF